MEDEIELLTFNISTFRSFLATFDLNHITTNALPIVKQKFDSSRVVAISMVRRVPLRSLGVFAKRSRTSPIFPHIPRHQPSSSFSTTFINNDASGPSTSFDLSGSGLSTINPSEISHFSRLSSQWWDPSGEFALLHRMNPCRIEYIRQIVALDRRDEPEWTFATRHRDKAREERLGSGRWLEGKRCLDVGCGGGLLSEVRANKGQGLST